MLACYDVADNHSNSDDYNHSVCPCWAGSWCQGHLSGAEGKHAGADGTNEWAECNVSFLSAVTVKLIYSVHFIFRKVWLVWVRAPDWRRRERGGVMSNRRERTREWEEEKQTEGDRDREKTEIQREKRERDKERERGKRGRQREIEDWKGKIEEWNRKKRRQREREKLGKKEKLREKED